LGDYPLVFRQFVLSKTVGGQGVAQSADPATTLVRLKKVESKEAAIRLKGTAENDVCG
jgi:hypothetical protein